MRKAITLLLFLIISAAAIADNIRFKVSGHVLDNRTMQPIQYAIVKVSNLELWAATDANGMFIIENVPQGTVSIEVSTLGYVTRTVQFNIRHNTDLKNIRLKEANLSIPGVEVTARKRSTMGTTTYSIDRTTLDHSQVLSLNDIMALLPGGQTVNSTLTDDSRLALRSTDTLWDEITRFENPHTYYVDLSQKLWEVKNFLLAENNRQTAD